MARYIIECSSVHKLFYVVESTKKKAEIEQIVKEKLADGSLKDFAQKWMGESIENITKVTDKRYIVEFDKYNLAQKTWSNREKEEYVEDLDLDQVQTIEDE